VNEPQFEPAKNDSGRFEALYQVHYPTVFKYVLRRLPADSGTENAADITAEVFATAWRRLTSVPEPPGELPWLYCIAWRILDRHRRGVSRRGRLMLRLRAEYRTCETEGDPDDRATQVRAALARLSAKDREALTLVLWEGLDHADAARVLGCSTNAFSVRLHRARARLRALLDGCEPTKSAFHVEEVTGPIKETRRWT